VGLAPPSDGAQAIAATANDNSPAAAKKRMRCTCGIAPDLVRNPFARFNIRDRAQEDPAWLD